jgi:hypothetical protein
MWEVDRREVWKNYDISLNSVSYNLKSTQEWFSCRSTQYTTSRLAKQQSTAMLNGKLRTHELLGRARLPIKCAYFAEISNFNRLLDSSQRSLRDETAAYKTVAWKP